MRLPPHERPGPLKCPRCDYDLSGVVASWRDACPIEGVCSECGLHPLWRDVLNPRFTLARWSFEHARQWLFFRWFATCRRCFCPASLWRGVGMHQPIRPARLALFVLGAAVLCHAASAAVAAYATYMHTLRWGLPPFAAPSVLPVPPVPAALRAAAWPFDWVANQLIGWQRWGWRPDLLLMWARWTPFLWTALMPAAFLVLRQTFAAAKIRRSHLVRLTAYSASGGAVVFTVGLMVALFVQRSNFLAFLRPLSSPLDWGWAEVWLPFVLWFVWFAVFWQSAISRYLRLPHTGWVLCLLAAASGLATALVLLCCAIAEAMVSDP